MPSRVTIRERSYVVLYLCLAAVPSRIVDGAMFFWRGGRILLFGEAGYYCRFAAAGCLLCSFYVGVLSSSSVLGPPQAKAEPTILPVFFILQQIFRCCVHSPPPAAAVLEDIGKRVELVAFTAPPLPILAVGDGTVRTNRPVVGDQKPGKSRHQSLESRSFTTRHASLL